MSGQNAIPLSIGHDLTGEDLEGIAAGYASGAVLGRLRDAQLSRRMLLLAGVRRVLIREGWAAEVGAALDVLRAAEQRDPGVIRELLLHPFVEVWGARMLRPGSGRSGPRPPISYLQELAAAAALRSGLDADVAVRAEAGVVTLPTLGAVRGAHATTGPAAVSTRSGGGFVDGPGWSAPLGADDSAWWPRRTVNADGLPEAGFAIEDTDPYRDCYHRPATGRLAPADVDSLHGLVTKAWRIIIARHPRHVAGLAACVTTLVPLQIPVSGAASAASRRAFGAVGLCAPRSPETLALLLLHEYEHVKLGAVLDLVPLVTPGGTARYYAPWRPDPRPAGALLQGVYAHLAVTEYWRATCTAEPGERMPLALEEYAYWRRAVRAAAHRLAESGELTPVGRDFVQGILAVVRSWDETLPRTTESAAAARAVRETHDWLHRYPGLSDPP
jgi:HEXXH motif-containing protein